MAGAGFDDGRVSILDMDRGVGIIPRCSRPRVDGPSRVRGHHHPGCWTRCL